MRVKGWGKPWENFREEQGWNHLLSGYKVHSLRPFPWKSSLQGKWTFPGKQLEHGVPLHHLSSPFACGADVQTSQTLPIWCLTQHRQFGAAVPPVATCLGPCEVSGVAIKSISRFRPMFKCSVNTALCLAFSCGRVKEPAQPSLCQAIFGRWPVCK